jgi:magnesium transporter
MPSLPRSPFGRRGRTTTEATPERTEPRVEIVEAAGLRWINIERPRSLEQAWLEEHFDFDPLDYEDVRSRNQRPKVDEYEEYLFIVLHFPRYDKQVSRLNAAEVDIFVGHDFLITLPNEDVQSIEYLFERCRASEELAESLLSKGTGYLLYKIIDDCVDGSFPMLNKIGNKLEHIEEEIFEGKGDEVVRDISNAKQEIINFRKVVRPQRVAFRDLKRATKNAQYIPEKLSNYFDDIIDASERVWDLLENYKEVVEGLEATNESAIAHRTNETFRVLTAISLIFLPLTLIASIFGMNVRVPGEEQTTPFWIIMAVMVAVVFTVAAFFRRRGWL